MYKEHKSDREKGLGTTNLSLFLYPKTNESKYDIIIPTIRLEGYAYANL